MVGDSTPTISLFENVPTSDAASLRLLPDDLASRLDVDCLLAPYHPLPGRQALLAITENNSLKGKNLFSISQRADQSHSY